MPPLVRFGAFVFAIASAFAGGYLIPHTQETRIVALGPPHAVAQDLPPPAPAAAPPTILLPPVAVHEPPKPEPVDPNDPAFQMIKNELGIKTTILDKSAPPPLVLTAAKRDELPTNPPPPTPMTGPTPKLETAPPINVGPVPPEPKPVSLLNSRAVELDFEVTKAGLSGIKAVELWTTRDGGSTWAKTDRMEGARPPFRTRLGSEGEYGFKLVFESESGMRTPDPAAGGFPDLVMELDTTPPVIQIYAPAAGPPGVIVLRWQATDRHLDRDPAATRLEYSVDGQTWQPIELTARHADRTGSNYHEWLLPPGVPPKVLLRVTVRDKAGNVGTAVTNEKVSVDLVAPEGKLTYVRPQGQSPELGPAPREAQAGAAADGAVPEMLRSVLPALLNSPLFGSALNGSIPSSTEASAAFSSREWVARLLSTNVVADEPLQPFRRHDPFETPEVGPDLQPISEPAPWDDIGIVDNLVGSRVTYHRSLLRAWGRMTDQQFRDYLAEYASAPLLGVLTDRDWQPSTAKPESYRWRGPTFAGRPFGGVFDGVPGSWGTPPGGSLWFDF